MTDQQHALIRPSVADGWCCDQYDCPLCSLATAAMIRGGHLLRALEPSPPSQDQGGLDDSEPDEDDVREQVRQAVAANQAENDAAAQHAAPACGSAGHARDCSLATESVSDTGHGAIAAWWPWSGPRLAFGFESNALDAQQCGDNCYGLAWASPLLAAFEDGNLSSCAHQVGQAFSQNSSPSLEHSRGGVAVIIRLTCEISAVSHLIQAVIGLASALQRPASGQEVVEAR